MAALYSDNENSFIWVFTVCSFCPKWWKSKDLVSNRHGLNKLSSFHLVLDTKIFTYFLNILNYLLKMKTHWLLWIQTMKAHLNEFSLPAQMCRVLELLYSSLPYSEPEKNEKMKTHWLLCIQTMKIHWNEFSLPAFLTHNPRNNLGIFCSLVIIPTNLTTFT